MIDALVAEALRSALPSAAIVVGSGKVYDGSSLEVRCVASPGASYSTRTHDSTDGIGIVVAMVQVMTTAIDPEDARRTAILARRTLAAVRNQTVGGVYVLDMLTTEPSDHGTNESSQVRIGFDVRVTSRPSEVV